MRANRGRYSQQFRGTAGQAFSGAALWRELARAVTR